MSYTMMEYFYNYNTNSKIALNIKLGPVKESRTGGCVDACVQAKCYVVVMDYVLSKLVV